MCIPQSPLRELRLL